MFIQTEATPNPATLKFLPGKVVMNQGTADFRDPDEAAAQSPLAGRLFDIDGVTGVFFGYDFVTITKDDTVEWQHLKPAVLAGIMEHFMSDAPVMATRDGAAEPAPGEEFYDSEDETIVATIKEGTVFLHMKGACAGCPSSTATLQHGIQNLLRHFIPEVQGVEAV